MRKIDGLHEPERFKGWVRQIAFREAIRFFTNKRDAREVQVSDQKSVFGVPTETELRWLNDGNSRDPLSILERSTDADCVQLALSQVSEQDRDVAIGHYYHGMSVADMSNQLPGNPPEGTVKRRLSDARRRIGEKLDGIDANFREEYRYRARNV